MAETSNEKSAARTALISLARVYPTRRSDRGFADDWLRALCEGYDNLEMELRCRLRSGERRDAEVRYDNAAAIRLLGMHPTNAERGRALRHHDDQAVLDSIDAMIRDMRDRAAANAVILAGTRRNSPPRPKQEPFRYVPLTDGGILMGLSDAERQAALARIARSSATPCARTGGSGRILNSARRRATGGLTDPRGPRLRQEARRGRVGPRDRPVAASLGETRAVMVEGESAAPRPTTAEGETWLFVSPREGMRIHDLSAGRDARYAGMACAGYPAATGGRVGGRYGSAYAIAAIVAALQQAGIFAEG